MPVIDINCDLGEGMKQDAAIMPYISSVNIACGYHAGNSEIMEQTIHAALQHNLAIGAHPGFDDKENFGRTEMQLSDTVLYDLFFVQLEILQEQLIKQRAVMHHVKPHGALYNMSASDERIATIIATAVKDFDNTLILYGLSNSYSIIAAERAGLRTAAEVFADRTYTAKGSLTPRTQAGAVLNDMKQVQQHVVQMVLQQTITATNGAVVPVRAETICLHGDTDHALEFAQVIWDCLQQNAVQVKAL